VNHLVAKGLSPNTIRSSYAIFTGVMRAAAVARMVPDHLVTRGVVSLPAIERKRERFLTEQEVERLLTHLPDHYRLAVRTAAYTGCRWQEIAGLKRCFLDVGRGRLHVRGVFERVGGKIAYREHPKTDAGRRTISLPPFLVRMLGDHLTDAESEWVFTAPEGGVLREGNFRRVWNRAVSEAELSPLTFHDLRHTHAAWLIRDGVQPLALQRRLGHRDIRTTMNIYGHLFPNFEEEVVVRLEQRWKEATEADQAAKIFSLPPR
jgi:integrase